MDSIDVLPGSASYLAEYVVAKDHTFGCIRILPHVPSDDQLVSYTEWPVLNERHALRRGLVCCWHDAHPLAAGAVPIFLPVAHDAARDFFWVYGVFCSFACATKFAHSHNGIYSHHTAALVKLMAHKVYDRPVAEPFRVAPARESLRAFGNTGRGGMTIDEFRRASSTTSYRMPPFLTSDNVNVPLEGQVVSKHEHVLMYKAFGDTAKYIMLSDFRTAGTALSDVGTMPESVCWHDTCPLDEGAAIVGIPLSYTDGVYSVYGIFCSFNCAFAYLLDQGKPWNEGTQMALLHRMAREAYHLPPEACDAVRAAPPVWDLDKFGGALPLRPHYRNALTQIDRHMLVQLRDHLEHARHFKVVWATTAVEYETDTLPPKYISLRNVGITTDIDSAPANQCDRVFDDYMRCRELGPDDAMAHSISVVEAALAAALRPKASARRAQASKVPKKAPADKRKDSPRKAPPEKKSAAPAPAPPPEKSAAAQTAPSVLQFMHRRSKKK